MDVNDQTAAGVRDADPGELFHAAGPDLGTNMSKTAALHGNCKEVRGLVTNASPETVNRVVCYCDDCQAFLHHLGRADLLDGHGGSDVIQIAPASLAFVRGSERIAGLRLTPKGIYRWYASCCKTPLGNTLGPTIPFVGVIAQAFHSETQSPDDIFGRPIGAIYGEYAVGRPPEGATGFNPRLIARAIGKVIGWRLRRQTWPHPFFERSPLRPRFPLTTLSPREREALRPLCGPHPSVRSDA